MIQLERLLKLPIRTLLLFVLTVNLFSNNKDINSQKISPYITKIVKKDLRLQKGEDPFFVELQGKDFIKCILKINNQFDENSYANDLIINDLGGEINTALVSIDILEVIIKDPNLIYLQSGNEAFLELNNAIELLEIDKIHLGTDLESSYTGKDVLVGIIDIGFDYSHEAFMDANGNSRIISVWNQHSNASSPPEGFGYGSEFIGSEIDEEGYDFEGSHGTHVAAIAVGSSFLEGVAPESDIVLVTPDIKDKDLVSTSIVDVLNGIKYIFNKAD